MISGFVQEHIQINKLLMKVTSDNIQYRIQIHDRSAAELTWATKLKEEASVTATGVFLICIGFL